MTTPESSENRETVGSGTAESVAATPLELQAPIGSRVVWKFTLTQPTSTGRSFADLPADAEAISVGLQNGEMVVWALVDPNYEPEEGYMRIGCRRFIVANTGQFVPGFPEGAKFLGTVTSDNGIVWHIWDGDAETTA